MEKGFNTWIKRHKERGDLDAEIERKIKLLDRIDKLNDAQAEKFEAFLKGELSGEEIEQIKGGSLNFEANS